MLIALAGNPTKQSYLEVHLAIITNINITPFLSGGFDIQEEPGGVVDRLLAMLNTFLISNQDLRLNETFKVYINVLSIDHMTYKKNNPRLRKTRNNKRKHYGSKSLPKNNLYQNYWSIDVPKSFPNKEGIFENACLLLCLILANLQHCSHENQNDLRFKYAQYITSKVPIKLKKAIEVLSTELGQVTRNLNIDCSSPLDFQEWAPILSNYFKCQIIIFSGCEGTSKIKFMYPSEYDDSLKPCYLYEPFEEPNHVIFIRHLKAFFRKNITICIACKKTFKSTYYKHLCQKIPTCFSCRRFFLSTTTYTNKYISNDFCDGKVANSATSLCPVCNVTLLSPSCAIFHKKICGKKGLLGYKCLKCNKFSYRSGENFQNSLQIKLTHICGQKICHNCKQYYPKDFDSKDIHLCNLKKVKLKEEKPNLAFFALEF